MSDLQSINISELLEKKGNLSYLSWAHAWGEALKIDPSATFEVTTFDRGDGVKMPYMDVNGTALVWVTVTMNGKPMTCQLPVMDHKNKAIVNPDAFAVNTAMMRCMVKAIALHGLGLYVYKGEDLPSTDEPTPEPAAKPVTPAVMEGRDGFWKIKVTLKPEGTDEAWIDMVCSATSLALDNANSKDDVMQIFQVNRPIYDHLKQLSKPHYDKVLALFKKMKDTRSTKE